jgi:hypothetical protein
VPGQRTHIESLESAFEDIVKSVPTITGLKIESTSRSAVADYVDLDQPDQLHGFEASLVTPSKQHWRLIVQTRASGDPRLVRESCARLTEIIRKQPEAERNYLYPVVAASYISKRSAEICKDMNVGYLDLSGNCRLAFESVFIERQVLENKHKEKRPLRSIFSAKSSRVVRLLLENPSRWWQVQELAKDAEISLGLASKVKQKLLDQTFVTTLVESRERIRPADPLELLSAWSREYSYKDNQVLDFYAPAGTFENEGKLEDYCRKENIGCALTLFSGGNRIAPFVRGISKSAMYVEADIKKVSADLGWKPVASGANFQLLRPFDDFIMRNTQRNVQEWTGAVVSNIQLYLDLASHRGRGEEAAEYLLEQKIKPQWAAQRSKS